MNTEINNYLTYDQVAERMKENGVKCGLRRLRDVVAFYKKVITAKRYGHTTVRFAVAEVDAMIAEIKSRVARGLPMLPSPKKSRP